MLNLYLLNTFINTIFIKGLFISVLSIIIAGKLLKTDNRHALLIIRWIILVYTALNISYNLLTFFSPVDANGILERLTGTYWLLNSFIFIIENILPFLLLIKRISYNKYILLAISFLINLSWLYNLFAIYSTNLHRDYVQPKLSYTPLWFMLLYGILLGSIIYAIGRIIERKRPEANTPLS